MGALVAKYANGMLACPSERELSRPVIDSNMASCASVAAQATLLMASKVVVALLLAVVSAISAMSAVMSAAIHARVPASISVAATAPVPAVAFAYG